MSRNSFIDEEGYVWVSNDNGLTVSLLGGEECYSFNDAETWYGPLHEAEKVVPEGLEDIREVLAYLTKNPLTLLFDYEAANVIQAAKRVEALIDKEVYRIV